MAPLGHRVVRWPIRPTLAFMVTVDLVGVPVTLPMTHVAELALLVVLIIRTEYLGRMTIPMFGHVPWVCLIRLMAKCRRME